MPETGAPPNVHPIQRHVLKALGALSSPVRPKPGAYDGPLVRGQGENAMAEVAVGS